MVTVYAHHECESLSSFCAFHSLSSKQIHIVIQMFFKNPLSVAVSLCSKRLSLFLVWKKKKKEKKLLNFGKKWVFLVECCLFVVSLTMIFFFGISFWVHECECMSLGVCVCALLINTDIDFWWSKMHSKVSGGSSTWKSGWKVTRIRIGKLGLRSFVS